MRGRTTTGIAKLAGIGIVAMGIALGSVAPAAASALTKSLDAGDAGGPVGARQAELINVAEAGTTERPHQTCFRIGFSAE
jgi:hypothetical protein